VEEKTVSIERQKLLNYCRLAFTCTYVTWVKVILWLDAVVSGVLEAAGFVYF
jgi:hypothetical protein